MDKDTLVSIFWFRRDLRLDDNAGLYHALKGDKPVLPIFIFDKDILDSLEDKDDARVTFIHQTIENLDQELQKQGSSLVVLYDTAENAWVSLIENYNIAAVYANHDYEPSARKRDENTAGLLKKHYIPFYTFKDQVIFDKDEVLKDDGKPYTVYTPYSRKWYQKLTPFFVEAYPGKKYFKNFLKTGASAIPLLASLGFEKSQREFPPVDYRDMIAGYAEKRNFPAVKGTTHIGLHLRFGTVSIRELVRTANGFNEKTWLNELIWREFYMMILYHFPKTAGHAFRPGYDQIKWVNNEKQQAICTTGYAWWLPVS
jgi:deoxyribodipyrimidine photo-lyase